MDFQKNSISFQIKSTDFLEITMNTFENIQNCNN